MGLVAGQTHEVALVDDLKRTQIVQYAGASGDYNPLHTDEVFATQIAGYASTFAHGMLTMGMTGRAITDLLGHDQLTSFGGRFTAQVWPGDALTARLTVDEVADDAVRVTVSTVNQDGVEVFAGYATARP